MTTMSRRPSSRFLQRALSSANALGDPYRLSILQRAVLVPYFGLGSLMDPKRGDLVAGSVDVTASDNQSR
jgi:hypothetical protein